MRCASAGSPFGAPDYVQTEYGWIDDVLNPVVDHNGNALIFMVPFFGEWADGAGNLITDSIGNQLILTD